MISKKLLKKVSVCAAAAMLIFSVGVDTRAADNDIPYAFELKANYENTYSAGRYCQTQNTSNKWKVDMTFNGEGRGTKAIYWLAKYNSAHTRVSDAKPVKQGSGAQYYSAYKGASQTNVCLGVENNNGSSKTYIVSGYWDEETD